MNMGGIVNNCSVCKTTIYDDETIDGRCEKCKSAGKGQPRQIARARSRNEKFWKSQGETNQVTMKNNRRKLDSTARKKEMKQSINWLFEIGVDLADIVEYWRELSVGYERHRSRYE